MIERLQALSNRLRDSGNYTADHSDVADASTIDEALTALGNLQKALDHVLPFVHLDIRDRALQIARGDNELEKLNDLVVSRLGREKAATWWTTPNPLLGDVTPSELAAWDSVKLTLFITTLWREHQPNGDV